MAASSLCFDVRVVMSSVFSLLKWRLSKPTLFLAKKPHPNGSEFQFCPFGSHLVAAPEALKAGGRSIFKFLTGKGPLIEDLTKCLGKKLPRRGSSAHIFATECLTF